MAQVESFAPVIGLKPRLLVLGSMPGVASLEAVQYYAHPRNAFWPIMEELFGIDHTSTYEQRIAALSRHPVILWDSLQACYRPGSLDAKINAASARANDFAGLLRAHPGIKAIAFNGATSERYFRKLALPDLAGIDHIELLGMPSTSPANAGMSFAQKLAAWRRLLDFID